MKIKVIRRTGWDRVATATRQTVHLGPLNHEPSDQFKYNLLRAEHSPIRLLEFDIFCKDVPFYISTHIDRHKIGCEFFVATSRPDRNGEKVSRHEQRKDDPVDFMIAANAQALINISRKRLCNKAEATTRQFWEKVREAVAEVDPIVAKFMARECIYRGFCPEIQCCKFDTTAKFKSEREEYINLSK